jgi:hypothetical protein
MCARRRLLTRSQVPALIDGFRKIALTQVARAWFGWHRANRFRILIGGRRIGKGLNDNCLEPSKGDTDVGPLECHVRIISGILSIAHGDTWLTTKPPDMSERLVCVCSRTQFTRRALAHRHAIDISTPPASNLSLSEALHRYPLSVSTDLSIANTPSGCVPLSERSTFPHIPAQFRLASSRDQLRYRGFPVGFPSSVLAGAADGQPSVLTRGALRFFSLPTSFAIPTKRNWSRLTLDGQFAGRAVPQFTVSA